ncbi:MAG: type II secretion system assembly factor GspB [Klebsiella huaxiensis]|uniref:type II secretion system assembly factor GspB n=1 Tax=Klebsiella huaxiensis TaxID=2153354 RepID=UPI0026EFEE59|nr:type II secretion system assembly factor GspB [Klebsiella huaxiensis]WEJ89421.1 MAG: type II secretion system assembly factor GspB [Klebsiella huaxiensis]
MLVRQQEPFPQPDEPPVVIGRMVQIPYVTVPLYAALLIALGWFGGEQWRNKPEPQSMTQPVAHAALMPLSQPPAEPVVKKAAVPVKAEAEIQTEAETEVDEDNLPPLRYSAHVYASLAEKRSIVLNGQSWKEGDSPLPNLVIEQIQQDVTVFSFNGQTFTLAALDDWPGGTIEESQQGE